MPQFPPRGRGFRNGGGSSAALPSWRQRRPAGRGRSAPPAPRSLGGLEESPPRRSPPVHSADLGRGGRAAAGGAGPGQALPLMRGDQRGAAPPAPRPRGPPTARLRYCAPWRPRRGTAARRAPSATRARSVVLLIFIIFFFLLFFKWTVLGENAAPAVLGSWWCRLSKPRGDQAHHHHVPLGQNLVSAAAASSHCTPLPHLRRVTPVHSAQKEETSPVSLQSVSFLPSPLPALPT